MGKRRVLDPDSLPNRIRELRLERGITLERLAEEVGLSPEYISRLEKGERNLAVKHFKAFADALQVPESQLLAASPARSIPVYGYVGLGEAIEWTGEGGEVLERFEFPMLADNTDLFALIGRGTSMQPLVEDGDIVIADRTEGLLPSDLLGKKAIVKLIDGPYLFKTIRRGSEPNRWNLESFNPAFPLRENDKIEAVWRYVGTFQKNALRAR